jgi:hypothetical protein
LQLLQYQNEHLVQKNIELKRELQSECPNAINHKGGLPSPDTNVVLALQQQKQQLAVWLEVQHQQNQHIVDKYNELVEELEGECLETSLRGGEVNFWQGHCEIFMSTM